jgi:hypothetical protein
VRRHHEQIPWLHDCQQFVCGRSLPVLDGDHVLTVTHLLLDALQIGAGGHALFLEYELHGQGVRVAHDIPERSQTRWIDDPDEVEGRTG